MAGNIYGFVELSASPYYSLTLDTGTPREPFVLPLTLIDSAKYISQWITVVGKRIRIHQLLIVCEQYVSFVWSPYFIVCTLLVKYILQKSKVYLHYLEKYVQLKTFKFRMK